MTRAGVPAPGGALHEVLAAGAQQIRALLPPGAAPSVALVLGSGLGEFADGLVDRLVVPFAELRGFPLATVAGHAGNLVYGRAGTDRDLAPRGIEVLALQGRGHYYEGLAMPTVVLPVRALIAAGCTTLIVTNAAGGIADGLRPGELVVLTDHLNLMGGSPLRGENDAGVGPRFPDLTDAYDPSLRRLATVAAAELGLELREGVYAAVAGPAYETPAEVRMLRTLGADLVGMSTVPEVIAARHMGARVLGISCVTNLAAGLSPGRLTHHEVTESAMRARGTFRELLSRILARLAADARGGAAGGTT